MGDVLAVEADAPAGGGQQPHQRAAERGFAGPGFSDDADRLAGADGEVDAVQDGNVWRGAEWALAGAVGQGDVQGLGGEQGGHCSSAGSGAKVGRS